MKNSVEIMIRRYPMALKSIKYKVRQIENLTKERDMARKAMQDYQHDRDRYRSACVTIFDEAMRLQDKGSTFNCLWLMKYITRRVAISMPFIWEASRT